MTDPTEMRNQPALTTSTGRIWLVTGGLFTAIAVIILALLLQLPPHGLAGIALVSVIVLYAGMVAVRFLTRPGRTRLGLLAALMLVIALVSLVSILVIAGTQVPAIA